MMHEAASPMAYPDEAAHHHPHGCGLQNHSGSFHKGMSKLKAKFDADPLLYSLSHFECDGHTVHMLTTTLTD